MFTLSLDSQGSEAGLAKLRQEVEEAVGLANDPLEILIAEEENGACSFPQCYFPCSGCRTKR